MRSSEHAAHRPLMHSVHIALWLKSRLVCHPCHPCMRTCGWCLELSVFFLVSLSFYFLSLFLFQLYLMSTSAPDERSMSNPLCDSSLGSVVTSDYVTPLTEKASILVSCPQIRPKRNPLPAKPALVHATVVTNDVVCQFFTSHVLQG